MGDQQNRLTQGDVVNGVRPGGSHLGAGEGAAASIRVVRWPERDSGGLDCPRPGDYGDRPTVPD